MGQGGRLAAVLVGVAAAVYVVAVELHRPSIPALDVYHQHLPMMIYAADAVRHGGGGLLWNPLQSCGRPFFAYIVAGLLYPPYLLYLVLEANLAVHVVLALNMVAGALGMWLLARQMGLGGPAALGAMLAFELGDPMVQLTSWSPTHSGPWAWLPWALLCCERLLRAPTRRGLAGLAAVLALQVLPGFILIASLTWQLLALRVAWEFVTRRSPRPWAGVLAVGAGMALAPMLTAVQILPAAELARESIRTLTPAADILQHGRIAVADMLRAASQRMPPLPFLVGPLLLAAAAPLASGTRRLAVFYLVVGVVYALLGFETEPLFGLFLRLPPGAQTLRMPSRLFWVSGFCLAILAGLGLQALAELRARAPATWLRPFVVVSAFVILWAVAPGGLCRMEVVASAVLALGALVAAATPRFARAAAWVAVGALAVNLVAVPLRWLGRLLPSVDAYWTYQPALAALEPPVTSGDRVFVLNDFASTLPLMQKTSTLLGAPGFYDYDALPSQRFVEYFNMMRAGRLPSGIAEAYIPFPWLTENFRRRLLDVASVRYLAASAAGELVERVTGLPRVPVDAPGLHVFRNDTALPRARWVPRVVVVSDAFTLLARLAAGDDDLSSLALVEAPPSSGYLGGDEGHGGRAAAVIVDRPEQLVINVDAPVRGFLVLADRDAPGWRATVNGAPASIVRANYLFRLVEVPAGRSRVEFRYRPASVLVGGALSVLGALMLAALLRGGQRRGAESARD